MWVDQTSFFRVYLMNPFSWTTDRRLAGRQSCRSLGTTCPPPRRGALLRHLSFCLLAGTLRRLSGPKISKNTSRTLKRGLSPSVTPRTAAPPHSRAGGPLTHVAKNRQRPSDFYPRRAERDKNHAVLFVSGHKKNRREEKPAKWTNKTW